MLRGQATRWLVAATAWCLALPAGAQFNTDHYRFGLVASTGASSFTTFGDNVSINRAGTVAFVGTFNGAEQVWRRTLTGNFEPLTNVPGAVYGRAAQINDSSTVVLRDRVASGSPAPTRIRTVQVANTLTNIASAPGVDYASVLSHPTINNNGAVVYTALRASDAARVLSNGTNDVVITAPSPRPAIADTGQVALNDNGTLKLYPQSLAGPATLAAVGGGFTELGNAPGISDDGRIVVFSGNRGAGRGVFASIDTGAGRQVVRIAGEGPPASPTRLDLPDLGFADNGTSLFFSDVDLANRVGVAHYPGGAAGIAGDSFVVAFLGTPNAVSDANTRDKFIPGIFFLAQRGLFTVRVDVVSANPLTIKRHVALPVIQVGVTLNVGGASFTVSDLQLHDPIAAADTDEAGTPLTRPLGSHHLAFWATDGSTQHVFRATQGNVCMLPVVRLSQATPPWGNDALAGHPQVTIQNRGCALAALTVAANRAAIDYAIDNEIHPGQLNTQMIAGNGFVGENRTVPPFAEVRVKGVNWAKGVQILRKPGRLYSAMPNALYFEPFKRSTLVPAQAQEARDYVINSLCDAAAPAPVIVGVDFEGSTPHHFVVVSGVVNGRFVIADVGYGDVTTLDDNDFPAQNWGNNFVTRGRIIDPPDVSSLTIAADDDVDFLVTDGIGRRVGFDTATSTEYEEIPGSAYFVDAFRNIPSGQAAASAIRSAVIPRPAAGSFTVTVRGRVTGPFTVTIAGIDVDGNDHPEIKISDTIAAGAAKTYTMSFDAAPGSGGSTLQTTTVPNVVGLPQATATATITSTGLTVGTITQQSHPTVPAGNVISQSLTAGAVVAAATTMNLVVSTGAGMVVVPNVIGLTQSAAEQAIIAAGLVVGTVTFAPSASAPAGQVTFQNPLAGQPVPVGTSVDFVISLGPICGTFTDVPLGNAFCPNIEWMKNRNVTLGCTATLYCPTLTVRRDQMAAFMNRLGTAITPLLIAIEQLTGAVTLGNGTVVCQTADTPITGYPRRISVEAIFMGIAGTTTGFGADVVRSFDGTTWVPLAGESGRGTMVANRWANARARGSYDLTVGQTVRFGLLLTRGDAAGTLALADSRCNLRAVISNRNGLASPF